MAENCVRGSVFLSRYHYKGGLTAIRQVGERGVWGREKEGRRGGRVEGREAAETGNPRKQK